MKKIILLYILMLSSILGIAQTDSIRGNQFELKGKIINEVPLTAHCGIFAWGIVVEFEIIEFSDSTYLSDSIGVIFTCPAIFGEDFFEVGKMYTMTIADENQANFGWMIPNESVLSKYSLDKKLWVITTDEAY